MSSELWLALALGASVKDVCSRLGFCYPLPLVRNMTFVVLGSPLFTQPWWFCARHECLPLCAVETYGVSHYRRHLVSVSQRATLSVSTVNLRIHSDIYRHPEVGWSSLSKVHEHYRLKNPWVMVKIPWAIIFAQKSWVLIMHYWAVGTWVLST